MLMLSCLHDHMLVVGCIFLSFFTFYAVIFALLFRVLCVRSCNKTLQALKLNGAKLNACQEYCIVTLYIMLDFEQVRQLFNDFFLICGD